MASSVPAYMMPYMMMGTGLGSMMGGMFGNSGAPYDAAMGQFQKYQGNAENVQNPFLNAGTSAIPDYQNWLKSMQDPTQFINNMMGQYTESPYAQYQQQQSIRAANNMASATGMTGSTPMQLQAQQNAQNISSKDMNSWLQNVLGINSEYGQGQNRLMGMGQQSANALTELYGQLAQAMGQAAYGKQAGENQDFMSELAGGAMIGASLFGL